jgi:hypothetical protein
MTGMDIGDFDGRRSRDISPGAGLAFAANFDFSRAAAGLAFAAAAAHRTRGFIPECGAQFVSRGFSSAVATCTKPVARGVTIVASLGGHAAPPAICRGL